MAKIKKYSPKNREEKPLITCAHFEPLGKEKSLEVINILASIICDYLERKRKNEREKNNQGGWLRKDKH